MLLSNSLARILCCFGIDLFVAPASSKKYWNLHEILLLYHIDRVEVFGSIEYGKNQDKRHP